MNLMGGNDNSGHKELRILMLEDVPADAELVVHELKKGGISFTSRRVETEDAFRKMLDEFCPDLILSDYHLPTFDGISALMIALEKCPDVPFIFVSGAMGEELAVEMLKKGAVDYVIKDRLQRLVPAMQRALKEKDERIEHKNLENQLLHAQKMEAVGHLAGGVAHDFNNILSAIVNYAYMIRSKAKEDDALINNINHITTLSMKAADITRGLLAFSRKHIIHPVPLRLNDSVKNMVKLLTKFIGEDICINIKLTDREPVVMADSAQLDQIIINLATNARDAMPDGGSLTIETDLVPIDNNFTKLHGVGCPGTYALLIITDTGTGMDEKTKQRIFEPFFTTKEVGKGSGLGLAIIYGIVKQHDGFINVCSDPGKGTTFKIYFQTVNAAVPEKEEIKPLDAAGNGETVLVAEDEEAVRLSVIFMLEKVGYRVIEAVNGEDAIEKYREHKNKIDLLLFDVIMPKKNGMEAYEEIRKITPGIKVIFTSGYSAEVIDKKGFLKDDLNYITKPVPPGKLLSTIKEVLQNAKESPQ